MTDEPLFPTGCTCQSYGHGLTMTRVHAPSCPLHSATLAELYRMTDDELRAGVNSFTDDDPPPYRAARGDTGMSGPYRTIVADPPWEYDSWPTSPARIPAGAIFDGRRTPIKYATMTVDEIRALPVRELADRQGCHLYLWTTQRYLPSAFGVLDVWGFRYSATLVWAKTPMGLGPGGTFKPSAEFILFGRRGTHKAMSQVDTCWFNWPRTGKHSRKPDAFLDLVERVSHAPRLELFARRQRLGWDTWGDEALEHVTLGGETPA